jgi:hypothetical protein
MPDTIRQSTEYYQDDELSLDSPPLKARIVKATPSPTPPLLVATVFCQAPNRQNVSPSQSRIRKHLTDTRSARDLLKGIGYSSVRWTRLSQTLPKKQANRPWTLILIMTKNLAPGTSTYETLALSTRQLASPSPIVVSQCRQLLVLPPSNRPYLRCLARHPTKRPQLRTENR